MGLQLPFGVKPLHECMKIAAFFLQLPPAVHFDKRQHLHTRGAESMVGGMWYSTEPAPHKAPCPHTNIMLAIGSRKNVDTGEGGKPEATSK